MNVAGRPYRTIWLKPDDPRVVQLIDQGALPNQVRSRKVESESGTRIAIRDMRVRGAGPRPMLRNRMLR